MTTPRHPEHDEGVPQSWRPNRQMMAVTAVIVVVLVAVIVLHVAHAFG